MYRYEIVGIFAVLCLVFCVGIFYYFGSKYQCESQWPQRHKPQFALITGCTIEYNGERIPSANFRAF